MKPRSALREDGHQAVQHPPEHLVQIRPTAQCPIDVEDRLERLGRVRHPLRQAMRAQVVDRADHGRVFAHRLPELHRGVAEDQLDVDDLDPAPVGQPDRLERLQPPVIEIGLVLAVEIDEVARAIGPSLDPGMVPSRPSSR